MNAIKRIGCIIIITLSICGLIFIYQHTTRYFNEAKILKEIVIRLEADSRIAEVLVTDVHYDEKTNKNFTTIKFLEYDVKQKPLEPKYFTFPGNIIQFQSLVMRFDGFYIKKKDRLRGKSAYLFWKVFMLDGPETKEFEIVKADEIPQGYKIENSNNTFEQRMWERFWLYALNPNEAKNIGVKNAQIEAPGMMFLPGTLYTIKIEHDGGMRIDTQPLPIILKGERIP